MDTTLQQQIVSDVLNGALSVLGIAITVLIGFISTKIRAWFSEKAIEAKNGIFGETVQEAVRYAEQYGLIEKMKVLGEKTGEELASTLGNLSKEKLAKAEAHVIQRMNSFGIKVNKFPREMIRSSIEAEVERLFSSTPTLENYSLWEAAVNKATENGVLAAEKADVLEKLKGDAKKEKAREIALEYLRITSFKIGKDALDIVIERNVERLFPKTKPVISITP